MRKQTKSKRKLHETLPRYASFAEAMFTELVQRALNELQGKLPPDMPPEQMAQWILSFLDRAEQSVHVRGRNGKISSVDCLDKIERNLLGAYPKENHDIVLPFMMAPDFTILQAWLFDLRERAVECGLKADDAVPILRGVLEKRLPDNRPLRIQRGELRNTLISELKQIKARSREFDGFESLKKLFPNFKVVEIVRGPKFKDDHRNYLASPSEWESKTATYSHAILKELWGLKSEDTLRGYRKAYNRSQKATLRSRPRTPSEP